MLITIVTGNNSKFTSAVSFLSKYQIDAEQVALPIIEPQEESIEKIALYKAEQAYQALAKPVVVMDSGWSIPALRGFPGPYMHFIAEWFDVEDILALMKSKTDRTVILENYACYKDADVTKVFTRKLTGVIKDHASGEGNIIDRVASFRKDLKTIAECKALHLPSADEDNEMSQWEKLAIWLKEYNS